MRTSVYIRVLLVKRMRRRTDGKNICEYYYKTMPKVFWIFPHTLLRLTPSPPSPQPPTPPLHYFWIPHRHPLTAL